MQIGAAEVCAASIVNLPPKLQLDTQSGHTSSWRIAASAGGERCPTSGCCRPGSEACRSHEALQMLVSMPKNSLRSRQYEALHAHVDISAKEDATTRTEIHLQGQNSEAGESSIATKAHTKAKMEGRIRRVPPAHPMSWRWQAALLLAPQGWLPDCHVARSAPWQRVGCSAAAPSCPQTASGSECCPLPSAQKRSDGHCCNI